jgi:dipeptidyl aminopeptidase/acylaminoacyl peptidase
MAGHPEQDILSFKGLDSPSFESVVTAGIKPQIFWFDSQWAKVQASVDAAVPGRVNLLQGNVQGKLLVASYGASDPGRWFLLDTNTSKLREIAEANARIDPKRLQAVETVTYRSRDGLTIPAYLTRPAIARTEPAPMVVLIHGGPNIRDQWVFDAEVQLLARAGYVVFQPQFRGSSGFGRRFEDAGYQQWGRAMQDDITDGVKWLVSERVADAKRICIYGASYGGYAALWGVIKTPELYKCGVSFAGISDLATWLEHSIFDDSTATSRELQRARVGDPRTMRQQLDDVSPLKHASQVNAPLLIAHGERDVRVLASQSKKMVAALKDLSKPVESMWFENEGHGFYWVANEERYYTALLKFLDKHIGNGVPVAPAAPAASASALPSAPPARASDASATNAQGRSSS